MSSDLAVDSSDLAVDSSDLAVDGSDLAVDSSDLAIKTFRWTTKKRAAVILDAQGYFPDEIARQVNISERTVFTWRKNDEYLAERSILSQMVGFSSKSVRLRFVQKVIRELTGVETLSTDSLRRYKTLLDYLNYARQETEAIKLELTTLLNFQAPVADS